jgi:hypothetical protein
MNDILAGGTALASSDLARKDRKRVLRTSTTPAVGLLSAESSHSGGLRRVAGQLAAGADGFADAIVI